MKRPILLSVTAVFLVACQDRPAPTGPVSERPLAAISDGAHTGGNGNFFFLPPMVSDPSSDPNFDPGRFNPVLSPVVEICLLDDTTNTCAESQPTNFPIVFTRATGPGSETIRVSETDEHYIVNWHTDQFSLSADRQYRIRVKGAAADQEWGFADVQPATSGKDLKNLDTGQLIGLKDGRTLPIKFRAEFGVYTVDCFNDDCVEEVVGAGGGTVTTPTKFAGVQIPAGALDNDVTIIIERIDTSQRECLPTDLRQFEGCYRYDTDPDLSEVQNSGEDRFNVDVTVGICPDPQGEDAGTLLLAKFDPENAGQGVVLLDNAPAAFVECLNFNGDNGAGLFFNRLRRYARAGWRAVERGVGPWFSPPPLRAGDEGPGGTTGSFTDIGWVLPATMSLSGGDGQTAGAGTTLPINPSVLVQATHPAPMPLAGIAVTFTVTGGGGSVSTAVVTTDANGIASTGWTLGATAGPNTLEASAGATGSPLSFTATGVEVPEGLVSWWPGDGNYFDIVGGNHGTPETDPVGFAPGISGDAFQFTGTDDVIGFPLENIAELQQLTVATWVNLDEGGPTSGIQRFVTLLHEKAVLRQVWEEGARLLHFYMNFSPITLPFDLHHIWYEGLDAGCFNHVAGTYDGSVMRLYLNGVLVGTNDVVGTVNSDGESGHFSNPPEPLIGLLDEVQVYSGALTAGDIQAVYDAGGAGKCAPPVPAGFGTPTIDALNSPGEWDNALTFQVFSTDALLNGSTLYVMNDEVNLYLALDVANDINTVSDDWEIRFDNANDKLQSANDDELFLKNGVGGFRDAHFDGTNWGIPDATIDGSGAVGTNEAGEGFFEMAHPLNSGDVHDFSVSAGDVLGLCIRYFENGTATSTSVWPLGCVFAVNDQTLYQEITVVSP